MEHITDINDTRLDAYARLTDLQLRNRLEPERGIFIAESSKVIDRALDAGYEPISLVVPEHRLERERALIERFETMGLPVMSLPASELEKLAGYEVTRGVLAAMHRKPLPTACELLRDATRVAVIDNVTNHANVGSVFRNAAALGIDAVFVTPGCSDPLYRRAVRVSMGTVFQVPWTRLAGDVSSWLASTMKAFREAEFKTAAFALREDSIPLDDPSLAECERLAMLFGTEGAGLGNEAIDACDFTVRIPMQNGVDSLNVAATSAIAFWQLRKR